MGVDIEWGLGQPRGNALSDALQSMQMGRQLGLQRQADNAFAALKADPNNQSALTTLAATDPQRANAFLTVAAANRAAASRAAAGNVIRSVGGFGQPQAPQQPAQSSETTVGLPATGQSVSIPKSASGAMDISHPQVQEVGAAASSGQVGPTEAWAALYASDPDLGDKMMAAVGKMDDMRRSRLAETSTALANAAQALKGVSPEQRQAAAFKMLPQLSAHGVTEQMIQNADLSDNGLNGIIGQSVGALGMMEQANKERGFSQKDQEIAIQQQNADTQRFSAQSTAAYQKGELNKPQVVPFGSSLVRPSGQVVSDGMGGEQAWTSDQLAGVVQAIPGAKITSMGRTPAHNAEVGGVANSQHLNTPDHTPTAIDFVAPNMTVEQVKAAFSKAGAPVKVIQHDAGSGMHFHVQADQAGGMVEALRAQAAQIASYQMPPPTGRAATSAQGAAIMQMVNQLNPDYDATQYHAKNTAITKFTSGKQADTIRSLNVAVDHLDQLSQASQALQNGNVRVFNGIAQSLAAATGSPVPTNFDGIKNFVMDEVTKAVIGAGGGVGDREKAQEVVRRSNSPQQLAQAIQQIQGLMGGQLAGFKRQYQAATGMSDFDQRFVSPRTQQVLEHHAPNTIPAAAVDYLKKNPQLRSQFDQKYGAGSSARILGS